MVIGDANQFFGQSKHIEAFDSTVIEVSHVIKLGNGFDAPVYGMKQPFVFTDIYSQQILVKPACTQFGFGIGNQIGAIVSAPDQAANRCDKIGVANVLFS